MFNVDGKEFIFLVLIALVVLGPEKLPDVFRRVGRLYSEVKRMSDGFQAEFQRAIEEPMNQVNETRDLVRESVDFRLSDDAHPKTGSESADNPESTDKVGTNGEAEVPIELGPAEIGPAEMGPTDVGVAEVDRDQAEVERRIAEMEQANATNFGGGGQTASTNPASHRPGAQTRQSNGTQSNGVEPETTQDGPG